MGLPETSVLRIGDPNAPRWLSTTAEAVQRPGLYALLAASLGFAMVFAFQAFQNGVPRLIASAVTGLALTLVCLVIGVWVWARYFSPVRVELARVRAAGQDLALGARLPAVDAERGSARALNVRITGNSPRRCVIVPTAEGFTLHVLRAGGTTAQFRWAESRAVRLAEFVDHGRAFDGIALFTEEAAEPLVIQPFVVGTVGARFARRRDLPAIAKMLAPSSQ